MTVAPRPQPRRVPRPRRSKLDLTGADSFFWWFPHPRCAWQALRSWVQENTFAPSWLPEPWRQPLFGALVAVLLAGGTTGLTRLLANALPVFALPGMLPMLGMVVVALTWGVGPSLLATFVGTALLEGVVLPHYFPVFREAWLATIHAGLFVLLGISVSLLASQSGRARWLTEELAHARNANQAWTEREHLRLRTLLDVLPVAVGMLDAQARVVETNPANQALWREGASRPGEVAAAQTWEGWWPETGQPVAPDEWAIMRALSEGETILNQEIAIEPLPGQRKVILESAAPIRDERGTILGAADIHQDITERKRLEEALRQAEREAVARAGELEAIFEALTDGLLVYDADGRILRSNTVARQLLGFEAHPEFGSLPWQERAIRYAPLDAEGQPLPPESLTLSRLLRGEVLTGAQAADNLLQTPDGREVAFSMTGRPLRNAKGEIVGAVAIARDVTERRRLEQEIAERAAQLETIFESIADGVIVTDRQERVLHMNQAARTLMGLEGDPTGWTLPQLAERAGFAVSDGQGQPLLEAETTFTRYLRGEVLTNEQSGDLLLHTREGRETLLNYTGAPVRDAIGQILGGVEVIRDVTEQRRLQQRTRETLNALLAMAEALVQTPEAANTPALTSAPRSAAEGDPIARVTARRLAELTRSVLGCQHVSMVAVESETGAATPITIVGLTPAQEQRWWASWDEQARLGQYLPPSSVAALRAGEALVLKQTFLPLCTWQDRFPAPTSLMTPMRIGETLVGLLRIDVRGDKEERAPEEAALTTAVARLGALVLERERLLRKQAEARASEMALRETQAQMENFLGIAGHELKNPLAVLTLSLQVTERRLQRLIEHGSAASQLFGQHLAQARHQVARLERLVNDLLDLARVRVGTLDLHLESIDLAAIVREAVEEQQQAHPARTLVFQPPADVHVPVWADADRLGQVVTNYLTNALKYSPSERPVEVGLNVQDQQARIWVRDEGPGLPLEEQERIWDRFHRAKGIEVQSGTGVGLGLGLHICRTIIERHQGRVGVESAPDQGSTFWFTLPLDSQEQV